MKPLIYFDFYETSDKDSVIITKCRLKEILDEVYHVPLRTMKIIKVNFTKIGRIYLSQKKKNIIQNMQKRITLQMRMIKLMKNGETMITLKFLHVDTQVKVVIKSLHLVNMDTMVDLD